MCGGGGGGGGGGKGGSESSRIKGSYPEDTGYCCRWKRWRRCSWLMGGCHLWDCGRGRGMISGAMKGSKVRQRGSRRHHRPAGLRGSSRTTGE